LSLEVEALALHQALVESLELHDVLVFLILTEVQLCENLIIICLLNPLQNVRLAVFCLRKENEVRLALDHLLSDFYVLILQLVFFLPVLIFLPNVIFSL